MINTRNLFGPLGVAMIAIGIALIALLVQLPALAAVFFKPSIHEVGAETQVAALIDRSDDARERDQSQFIGRSAFFIPGPPPPPPDPVQPHVDPPAPRIQPAPGSYGGPQPVAIIGDQVWFNLSGSLVKLRPAESSGTIRLVEAYAPWSVKVAWKKDSLTEEGEYVVRLFADLAAGFTPPPVTTEESPGDRREMLQRLREEQAERARAQMEEEAEQAAEDLEDAAEEAAEEEGDGPPDGDEDEVEDH
jgi:hypothetical protein